MGFRDELYVYLGKCKGPCIHYFAEVSRPPLILNLPIKISLIQISIISLIQLSIIIDLHCKKDWSSLLLLLNQVYILTSMYINLCIEETSALRTIMYNVHYREVPLNVYPFSMKVQSRCWRLTFIVNPLKKGDTAGCCPLFRMFTYLWCPLLGGSSVSVGSEVVSSVPLLTSSLSSSSSSSSFSSSSFLSPLSCKWRQPVRKPYTLYDILYVCALYCVHYGWHMK